MDNKKLPRVDAGGNSAPVSTAITSLPLATLAGQSFFFSNSASESTVTSSGDVLLTICDGQSEDSQDFMCVDDSLARLKEEEEEGAAGLQYHISPPLQMDSTSTAVNSSNISAVLPTDVQLPSGCDIYLVKEYVKEQERSTTSTPCIRLEASAHSSGAGGCERQQMRCNAAHLLSKSVTPAAGSVGYAMKEQGKRSYVLEAYKKRDDKRRATHNEVERRRRDKINSWIFKLKELLPDMPLSQQNSNNANTMLAATQERGITNHSRTPSSDSKSQILIKACEYIRNMQEELKSLRECLSENENLRLNNQYLRDELNKVKQNENQSQSQSQSQNSSVESNSASANTNISCNNKSFSVSLNGLRGNSCVFAASTPATAGSYTKRELIIRDYVD